MDKIPAPLLVLMSVISINIGSALAVKLLPLYGTSGVMFLRMAIGSLILLIVYRKSLLSTLKAAPLGIFLLGLFIALQSYAFYEALIRIPLGVTVAIEFLGPLTLALFSSRRWTDAACVLLAVAGVLLLTPEIGRSLDLNGVLFALGSGLCWIGVILLSTHLSKKLKGGTGMALSLAVCALLVLPVAAPNLLTASMPSLITLLMIMGVALFSASIPYLFEYLALRTMPAQQFGILIAMEPVIAAITGGLLLAQMMNLNTWIAIALISLASALSAMLTIKPRSSAYSAKDN